MARVLIVGCGYLGSRVGQMLGARGDAVFGVTRSGGPSPDPIRSIRLDVASTDFDASALPDAIDSIVYSVSPDDGSVQAYERAFRSGLENTLSVARDKAVARFVFVSSTSVFGQRNGEWVDETSPTEPEQETGRIVLEAEQRVIDGASRGVAVRASGIYGPPRLGLVDRVRAGTARYAPGHITNRIFVSDLARAVIRILDADTTDSVYVATDDEPVEQRLVLEWLAKRLGAPAPQPTERLEGRAALSNKRCRNARLRGLGWRPEYPTFREGYEQALAEIDSKSPA